MLQHITTFLGNIMALTKEEIWKIADDLGKRGEKPTLTLADQLTQELEKVKIDSEKQKEENKKQSQKLIETEKANAELRIENAKLQERFDNSEKHNKEMAGQIERLQDQLVELVKAGKPGGG